MKSHTLLSLIASLWLIAPPTAISQEPKLAMSPKARAYLTRALQYIQHYALKRKSIDWHEVTNQAFDEANGAQFPSDTYQAIAFVLNKLDDHHSGLLLPNHKRYGEEAVPNSVSKSGDGQSKDATDSKHNSAFTIEPEPEGSAVRAGAAPIALLKLPGIVGETFRPEIREYAESGQKSILKLLKQNVAGWIIDLRGNSGGNWWPMLATIGPLAGADILGGSREEKELWYYRQGIAGYLDEKGREHPKLEILYPLRRIAGRFPIAVLIDRNTASAGEITALAFKGRSDTRFFGQHTFGLTTSTTSLPLSDGATLIFATGIDVDRTGIPYPDGLMPDVLITPEQKGDAAIEAAIDWIDAWEKTNKSNASSNN